MDPETGDSAHGEAATDPGQIKPMSETVVLLPVCSCSVIEKSAFALSCAHVMKVHQPEHRR